MSWFQHTQERLMEKVSWAEDFFSHTLIRWCFRRWLKVCLLHNGETTPREPASAILSHHHNTYLHTCSLAFAGLCCPLSCITIPFLRDLLSALHIILFSLGHSTLPTSILHTLSLFPADFHPTPVPVILHSHCLSAALYAFIGMVIWEEAAILTSFCLPSLVQRLPLHSGGESKYSPCSLS